jgi:hypothetical protein
MIFIVFHNVERSRQAKIPGQVPGFAQLVVSQYEPYRDI